MSLIEKQVQWQLEHWNQPCPCRACIIARAYLDLATKARAYMNALDEMANSPNAQAAKTLDESEAALCSILGLEMKT